MLLECVFGAQLISTVPIQRQVCLIEPAWKHLTHLKDISGSCPVQYGKDKQTSVILRLVPNGLMNVSADSFCHHTRSHSAAQLFVLHSVQSGRKAKVGSSLHVTLCFFALGQALDFTATTLQQTALQGAGDGSSTTHHPVSAGIRGNAGGLSGVSVVMGAA
uniref:Uncharacterized protein n=1 Tax=Nothobranchius furzeri TaxID=105023 RepID=A0A1A8B865_NOTFU